MKLLIVKSCVYYLRASSHDNINNAVILAYRTKQNSKRQQPQIDLPVVNKRTQKQYVSHTQRSHIVLSVRRLNVFLFVDRCLHVDKATKSRLKISSGITNPNSKLNTEIFFFNLSCISSLWYLSNCEFRGLILATRCRHDFPNTPKDQLAFTYRARPTHIDFKLKQSGGVGDKRLIRSDFTTPKLAGIPRIFVTSFTQFQCLSIASNVKLERKAER